MASVLLENLVKQWNTVVAVDDISLKIQDQEFLVLLGPSGCGKTTTMRMIAGLEEPSSGDIYIGEHRVNDHRPKERDVAMVFQNYGLYPHMTVRDNIGYPLKVRKIPKSQHASRIEAAAKKVELSDLLNRRPRELSGGQRQRVALARAIVRTPTVFLMDEPLSNLDAKLRVSMRAQLKHLQHELAITTIYVTHDQIEAMTLADRVAVMDQGKISQLDTPENIYNDPANLFVAGFIGSPAMNLIGGTLQEGCFQHPQFQLKLSQHANPHVTLGVRPEDLEIVAPQQGNLTLPVYSFELTGESTLVTAVLSEGLLTIRGPKHFRVQIDEPIGLRFHPEQCYLFDNQTGQRLYH